MRQLKINFQITSRESISLEKYLQEIARLDLLTPEQEVELAMQIQQGDKAALEKLVTANLRFVVSVAKQYQGQGLDLIDLINEGNLGLIKAANRFDHTKGFKFISYAVWWIRQSIMQSLMDHARIIRLPLNKIESYQKINKELLKFLQENERQPTARELSEITGLKIKEVQDLLQITAKPVSIDSPSTEDEDSLTLLDVLEAQDSNPETDMMAQSLKDEVGDVLAMLAPREREILMRYYGLGGFNPSSLEDVAEACGLTRERVRQIKERLLRRLRKGSKSRELKGYL